MILLGQSDFFQVRAVVRRVWVSKTPAGKSSQCQFEKTSRPMPGRFIIALLPGYSPLCAWIHGWKMTNYSNDAFLSHSGADKPSVEIIAAALEQQGVKCFLDKWDILPGDQWMRNLENELSGSRTILIFFGSVTINCWKWFIKLHDLLLIMKLCYFIVAKKSFVIR